MPLVPRYLRPSVLRCSAAHPASSKGDIGAAKKAALNGLAGLLVLLRRSSKGGPRANETFFGTSLLTLIATLVLAGDAAAAGVRVRDVAMIAGARDNQLVGYGLVVGLAGEGDKDPVYTQQTLAK